VGPDVDRRLAVAGHGEEEGHQPGRPAGCQRRQRRAPDLDVGVAARRALERHGRRSARAGGSERHRRGAPHARPAVAAQLPGQRCVGAHAGVGARRAAALAQRGHRDLAHARVRIGGSAHQRLGRVRRPAAAQGAGRHPAQRGRLRRRERLARLATRRASDRELRRHAGDQLRLVEPAGRLEQPVAKLVAARAGQSLAERRRAARSGRPALHRAQHEPDRAPQIRLAPLVRPRALRQRDDLVELGRRAPADRVRDGAPHVARADTRRRRQRAQRRRVADPAQRARRVGAARAAQDRAERLDRGRADRHQRAHEPVGVGVAEIRRRQTARQLRGAGRDLGEHAAHP
jgi:hypothetical protein